MLFLKRLMTWTRAAHTILVTLLVAALVGIGAGCDTGGANGDGDGDSPDTTAPAAPSDLSGEVLDATVALSWGSVDAEDLAGYNVYRDTASIGDNVEGLDPENGSLLSETSYTDGDIETGTTYYYRVTAVDTASNESDPSNEVERTPQASVTAPAAPSGLTADADSAKVRLDWSPVDDADVYSVYRDTSSTDSVSGSALDAEISQASYTDETAEPGTTYYYRVTAVAREGEESAESDGSGEVPGTPFTPPTALEGTSRDSQIELEWTAAIGGETYNVYRDTSSMEGADGDPLTTGVSEAAYTDTTAENGTKYYYRVTSINPEGEESTASNEVERTPFSDPPDRP